MFVSAHAQSLKSRTMSDRAMICLDGVIAGLIGAAIVAIWFLFMDTVTHLPLYTPTVLGEGLLLREQGLASNAAELVSLKTNRDVLRGSRASVYRAGGDCGVSAFVTQQESPSGDSAHSAFCRSGTWLCRHDIYC